ncbi:hypothetical protein G7054_g8298 [Neopestalotiopsis clavispora]|nr:hypothetical protein G7054_g8298 [Neopestalotiopsis clavispora]
MGDAISDVTLDSIALSELNSPEARALLDTVDSLRELQVGEIVNLPQIIVVGDQSSGKSSVLEAISRVRFPARGDLCTRFATELVLRRAPDTRVSVTIDSGQAGTFQPFKRTTFDKDDLPDIITEATEKMGFRPGSSKGFSRDILRVEITDPDVYPVTLVDLPGFFHAETADQTKEGRKIVRQLAKHYMKQANSIILAVVSANHNLANQLVVEEARKHDPNRDRTLGVITKPDLAAPGSQDERKCLQLIRGQENSHKLKLGWHVLRNMSEGKEHSSIDERDAQEAEFFGSGAWSSIAPISRGISCLRKKLSKVLLEHIQKTLPSLVEEIETSLSTRQCALENLGKPRATTNDLKAYLVDVADKFRRLTMDGVGGRYGDEFFGDLYDRRPTRKLRAHIRAFNRAFHATLITKGVDREIIWDDEDSFLSHGGFDWVAQDEEAPEYLKPFLNLFDDFPEPICISEEDLREELVYLGAANQGIEFSSVPNAQLGYQLFRKQAKPWRSIAEFYLDQITVFAKTFVEDLFVHILGTDVTTTNAILTSFVDGFFEHKRGALKDKLGEIIRPYLSGYGPPLDAEFHAALSTRNSGRETRRIVSLLEERFPEAFSEDGGGLNIDDVEETIKSAGKAETSEFGTEKVIDMAMTHYELSLRTFADNVVNLAAENCLISELPTILTPSMVIYMDEERLKELASESDAIQTERNQLQHEIKILREGLQKCQRFRLHQKTVLPLPFMALTSPVRASNQALSPSRLWTMRVVDVESLAVVEIDETTTPYAILSHRWEEGQEVSLSEMKPPVQRSVTRKSGYRKIKKACAFTLKMSREHDLQDLLRYIWIDTCCIDKTSSAELSEAINSMYRWYEKAVVCFAFLSDVSTVNDIDGDRSELSRSAWFSRGWTLQELLAPKEVIFLSSSWDVLGSRTDLCQQLSRITSIESCYLNGEERFRSATIACRMSWAAKRTTKRPEDQAYCLLGIFDVNMPLLYGEGLLKAFRRLQEEILRDTIDESIFAWWQEGDRKLEPCGILARTPQDFAHSGDIVEWDDAKMRTLDVTRRAIKLQAISSEELVILQCGPDYSRCLTIPLAWADSNHFFRADDAKLGGIPLHHTLKTEPTFVMKKDPEFDIGHYRFDVLFDVDSNNIEFGKPTGDNFVWDPEGRTLRRLILDESFVVCIPLYFPDEGIEVGLWLVSTAHIHFQLKVVALVPPWESFQLDKKELLVKHSNGYSGCSLDATCLESETKFPVKIPFSSLLHIPERNRDILFSEISSHMLGGGKDGRRCYKLTTKVESSALKRLGSLIADLKAQKEANMTPGKRAAKPERKERHRGIRRGWAASGRKKWKRGLNRR